MKNNRRVPTAPMLMIRVAIGAYLIYLSYNIYSTSGDSSNASLMVAFAVLFSLGGIVAMIFGLKDLIRGRYVGGPGEPIDDKPEIADEQAIDDGDK